jgi:hypothetical protein
MKALAMGIDRPALFRRHHGLKLGMRGAREEPAHPEQHYENFSIHCLTPCYTDFGLMIADCGSCGGRKITRLRTCHHSNSNP